MKVLQLEQRLNVNFVHETHTHTHIPRLFIEDTQTLGFAMLDSQF